MGYDKDKLTEFEDRGFADIEGYICADCINDEYLKNWIIENATSHEVCSYCGQSKKSISMELFTKKIMETINFYYEDVNNYGEQVYNGDICAIYDTEDILQTIADKLGIDFNSKLINDLKPVIQEKTWCKSDPYGLDIDESLKYSWQRFSNLIKHKSRYMFFSEKTSSDSGVLSPLEILENIASDLKNYNMIHDLPSNTTLFRCRAFNKKEDIKTNVEELVSPPDNLAKANRMSAEGISVFYGSFKKDVALRESTTKSSSYTVCAEFKTLQTFNCLDLTKIKGLKCPSFFDTKHYKEAEMYHFYHYLNKQLVLPVSDFASIRYAPIQVFAEYCKTILGVDAIIYESAKVRGNKCIVLFFNKQECLGNDSPYFPQPPKLELKKAETYSITPNYSYDRI